MRHRYFTLDVFTDRAFSGNQLAVFPDAVGIDPARMQAIARELNLSETVFVLPPERGGTVRVRIFTPGSELPFAGHPTVGTAVLLAVHGRAGARSVDARIVLEEGVGPVPVTVRAETDESGFAQLTAAQLPEYGPGVPPREVLGPVLSLAPDDIHDEERAETVAVSCGVPFLMVPIRSGDALRRARIDMARWERDVKPLWANKPYLYTSDTAIPGATLQARMFGPAVGIPEDPATGSAAVTLAGHLAGLESADGTYRWTIAQGIEMGRPSRLEIEADRAGGRVVAARVGGHAVLVAEGMMRTEGP